MMNRTVGGLVLLCVVGGCTPQLDHKALEEQITTSMKAKNVNITAVSCPDSFKLTKGATFQCTAKDENGTTGTFDVTASGDMKGTVSWELRGKFEDMAVVGDRLEQGLSKNAGQPVDVQCPTKNVIIQKGVTFSCTAVVGPKTEKFVFTAKDDQGNWDTRLEGH